ncbi:hypothetical protein ASPZODRAFT_164235 [Penicilliopsis zonata CBS 506.65]|uniref:Uncharacterized protein n=1 Tax=Penicilliopsis zonata CBS 506.65 TaxID=1073090 RepID=A0A1L9SST1_9EURO|nr:hypothetical protein ASPZODRAFT_164235 [Penicilliopsis zonata CBS 506.65]OJJ50249.1 hypothetical protein ASPZODRAFT_164235 [Penicilliopsis zonata CBS 506.65]
MPSLTVASVLAPLALFHLSALACELVPDVNFTFFGFPDNHPPGAGIAFDCGRGHIAGGLGTFEDPVTFASAVNEFNSCEVIYAPSLHKYLRFEDVCEQCTIDWANGVRHIDIWTGNNSFDGGDIQIACENNLTTTGQFIVRGPPASLPLDTTPLFDSNSLACAANHTFLNEEVSSICPATVAAAPAAAVAATPANSPAPSFPAIRPAAIPSSAPAAPAVSVPSAVAVPAAVVAAAAQLASPAAVSGTPVSSPSPAVRKRGLRKFGHSVRSVNATSLLMGIINSTVIDDGDGDSYE